MTAQFPEALWGSLIWGLDDGADWLVLGLGKMKKTSRQKQADGRAVEGIWYVVRDLDGWRVFPHLIQGDSEIDGHAELWERVLAPWLAERYKLSKGAAAELALHHYGFPRGRVTLVDGGVKIYHGDDWRQLVAAEEIEFLFNPAGGAEWVLDEHEVCLDWDREQVRGLLGMG